MDIIETVKIIASLITAVGVISGAYALLWGNLAKKIVGEGIKKLKKEHIVENDFFRQISEKDSEILNKLGEISAGVEDVSTKVSGNTLAIKRQELLFLIKTEPHRVESIERINQEYKALGGNSYVCDIVEIWREKHARPELEERLTITKTTRTRKAKQSRK